jgi:hypothetical protein
MMNRRISMTAVFVAVLASWLPASAQEPTARPGFTFTPSFGFSELYDDNITLFGRRDAAEIESDDFITSYSPQAQLHYVGRRTNLGGGYGASLLDYRTFSRFNRWDQQANVTLRRTETARLNWGVHGTMLMTPSTDALDFAGIPFSPTGATTLNGRANTEYALTRRDSVSASFQLQKISFERNDDDDPALPYLRGGRSSEATGSYRRRMSARTAIGASYGLRRASAIDEPEDLRFHATRASVEFIVSERWSVDGGAGLDFVMATPSMPAQRAPAFSVSATRSDGRRRFHVGYQRLFLPSFGFGGAMQSQDANVTFYAPLFGSPRFYTEQGATFHDSVPLVEGPGRLKLRSFRTNSRIGWAPRPWVRVEGFYSRVMQTTLIPGGAIDRNRIGFVIVTSRPMRVQ